MIKLENLEFYSAKKETEKDNSILIMANDNSLVSIPSFENFVNTDALIKSNTKADIEIDTESKSPNFKVIKMTIAGEKGALFEYYILPLKFSKKEGSEGVLSSASTSNIFKDLCLGQEFSLKVSLK